MKFHYPIIVIIIILISREAKIIFTSVVLSKFGSVQNTIHIMLINLLAMELNKRVAHE